MNRIRKSSAKIIQLLCLTFALLSIATKIEAQPAKELNHLAAEQSWNITTDNQKKGMLLFRKGDFYLSNQDSDEQPQWTFAGSIAGIVLFGVAASRVSTTAKV